MSSNNMFRKKMPSRYLTFIKYLFSKLDTMHPHYLKIIGFLFFITHQLAAQQVENGGVDLTGFSTNFYSLPFIDLNDDIKRQITVDKEENVYLGHPSTVLLEDGKTIIIAYPKGHGSGALVMKKSLDGGLTWSDRLPVPENWATSQEVPTFYPVVDALGKKRIIMFSGKSPARMAVSEGNGESWSPLEKIGDWGGIVLMGDVINLNQKGHYMALFHDDQRFILPEGRPAHEKTWADQGLQQFTLFKTVSTDGGLTWSYPDTIFSSRVIHLCEPGVVRSPDGKQIAVLLRENSRRMNSHIIFSEDEGKTWSPPRELPNALTGDRHQAIYTPEGRLLISFRDNSPGYNRYQQLKKVCADCDEQQLHEQAGPVSPTFGDWVGWVGTYEDLREGKEGQYRIRFKDNKKGGDCAYPALELLPDGTIVATTYGHWNEDEQPYILSFRFTMDEIDAMHAKQQQTGMK